jgi:hypothetical protein
VSLQNDQTPIHAAAKVGNIIKLRTLLCDVKNRYQNKNQDFSEWLWELSPEEEKASKYKKRNLYP